VSDAQIFHIELLLMERWAQVERPCVSRAACARANYSIYAQRSADARLIVYVSSDIGSQEDRFLGSHWGFALIISGSTVDFHSREIGNELARRTHAQRDESPDCMTFFLHKQ